jgi:hypothetical protein
VHFWALFGRLPRPFGPLFRLQSSLLGYFLKQKSAPKIVLDFRCTFGLFLDAFQHPLGSLVRLRRWGPGSKTAAAGRVCFPTWMGSRFKNSRSWKVVFSNLDGVQVPKQPQLEALPRASLLSKLWPWALRANGPKAQRINRNFFDYHEYYYQTKTAAHSSCWA